MEKRKQLWQRPEEVAEVLLLSIAQGAADSLLARVAALPPLADHAAYNRIIRPHTVSCVQNLCTDFCLSIRPMYCAETVTLACCL